MNNRYFVYYNGIIVNKLLCTENFKNRSISSWLSTVCVANVAALPAILLYKYSVSRDLELI